MIPKKREKIEALILRRRGLSYSEILNRVPVAKSTLSLWLRSEGLSKKQEQRLTKKKLNAMKRGSLKVKQLRIERVKIIEKEAISETGKLMNNPLWLAGVLLYWAEGTKERENNIGAGVQFGNSDSEMIRLFVKWLRDVLKIEEKDLFFQIYVHKSSLDRIPYIVRHWAKVVKVSSRRLSKNIYFKRHNPKTNRKNTGNNYFGLIRIGVRKSSILNRKIGGWIRGVCGIL